jgi:hypothetical protein
MRSTSWHVDGPRIVWATREGSSDHQTLPPKTMFESSRRPRCNGAMRLPNTHWV